MEFEHKLCGKYGGVLKVQTIFSTVYRTKITHLQNRRLSSGKLKDLNLFREQCPSHAQLNHVLQSSLFVQELTMTVLCRSRYSMHGFESNYIYDLVLRSAFSYVAFSQDL